MFGAKSTPTQSPNLSLGDKALARAIAYEIGLMLDQRDAEREEAGR